MAATLGLTNMSDPYPSFFPTQWNSEFSHYDQVFGTGTGTDQTNQFIGTIQEKQESIMIGGDNEAKKPKEAVRGSRIGFRTKSELDVLDDGFKWRKYGKKAVKNSPNPRNYYRCTSEGCHVKKRVERDRLDPIYVITTYEGVHNHFCPDTVMCQNYHYTHQGPCYF